MIGWGSSARLAWPAWLWIALLFAAFHDKAYTIDDPFFLAQARQVLEHPLDPSGFDLVWGTQVGRASTVSPTGPGMAWLLAPTVAAGAAEWMAHATVFALFALGAWSLAVLAQRLGASPAEARWAAGALAATPVAVGMAGTAMPDVPAMALAVVAMERSVAFRRDGRATTGALAALAFAAAILLRSQSAMLLLVAALFGVGAWLRAPRGAVRAEWRRLAPLAAAALLALAVAWLTRDTASGATNFATTARFLDPGGLPLHATAFAFHYLLALPFALAWSVLHWRRLSWRGFLAATLVLAFALPLNRAWAAPFAAFAAVALWDALRSAWRSGDADRLALAAWLVAAFPVVIYVHVSAKYLLVSAPAAVLLLLFEAREASPQLRRRLRVGWLVGGAVLGVAILRADARLAEVGRAAAGQLVAPRVAAGERVFYAGSWGFQWYAQAAGARPLAEDPDAPAPGDSIVYSRFRFGGVDDRHRGEWEETVYDAGPGGRVMDRAAGAGFYSDEFGFLPWSFGTGVVDAFDRWRLTGAPATGATQITSASRNAPISSQE